MKAGGSKFDYAGKGQKVFEGIVKNLKFLGADGQILTAGKSGKIPPGQISGTPTNTAEAFRYFYHPDLPMGIGMGSTSYVTDAAGEVYQHLEYFAFGETFVEEHSNTDRTPYLFNGKELDEETGLYLYGLRYYDPRTSIWLGVDPLAEKFPNWSPYVYTYNNPLNYIDPTGMGPDDPETHTIQKGETLTSISKKYGVSVDDLAKLNGIENKNKIKAGATLKVNPEVDFKDNPHGGYRNPNNAKGEKVTMSSLVNIAAGFAVGTGGENHIIVGGGSLESIQGWDKVTNLISKGMEALNADGKLTPGETFTDRYSPGTLASYMKRALKGEEDLISPVHIIGSFSFTMRVNADKKSVTIALYDWKSMSSASDHKLDDSSNRTWDNSKKNSNQPLTNQYFRFIWNQQIKK